MAYQKYLQLIAKLFRMQMTPKESAELQEWLSHPDENGGFDEMCHELWIKTPNAINENIEADMFECIKGKMPETDVENIHARLPFYKMAAAILFVVSIGLGWYAYHMQQILVARKGDVIETLVKKGQKAQLTLPDGTKVWLNSATQLSYDGSFNLQDRKVKLDGEAYFEVAKHKDKPFIVECNEVSVEALGTVFNVKNYHADSVITTSLIEGSVRVSDRHSGVTLEPRQSLVYTRNGHSFSVSEFENLHEIDFWRRNILYFDSTPLSEIAKTIERMYDIKVVFVSKDLEDVTFSGTIKNNSLENVFHLISFTYPVKYEFRKDTVYLSHK
ncbi:FecR family protein [Prevotella sp. KH2C16]|uniref:FecR family protein n=1 Tax=Prevotella sp. KH2C16 TaxID=1855325 RepID=UPI0008E1ED77|nr:FecR domain-containing protein [Prevotella sp. KH2C16]SFG16265.1 ferric-dicitrate binding protein FerR, regulates iron transport through sigma-19 [Prevotella sp. KH2C16]